MYIIYIQTLANHYMEPFRLVMQQYSRVAAALRSAEMIAAEVSETLFNLCLSIETSNICYRNLYIEG